MKTPLALSEAYRLCIRSAGSMPLVPHNHSHWVSHCTWQLTSFQTEALHFWHKDCDWRWEERGIWLVPPGEQIKVKYYAPGQLDWIHFTLLKKAGDEVMDDWTDFGMDQPGRAAMCEPDSQAIYGVNLPIGVPGPLVTEIQAKIAQVTSLWYHNPPLSKIDAQGLLADCLHQWVRYERERQFATVVDEVERRLLRAELYARRHMQRGLSVEIMADHAGYERSHFSVLYKQRRGHAPGEFIRKNKMQQAALLLRTQDLPMKIVSELVGYPNATTFGRAFKQWFNQSPGEYHKEQRGL